MLIILRLPRYRESVLSVIVLLVNIGHESQVWVGNIDGHLSVGPHHKYTAVFEPADILDPLGRFGEPRQYVDFQIDIVTICIQGWHLLCSVGVLDVKLDQEAAIDTTSNQYVLVLKKVKRSDKSHLQSDGPDQKHLIIEDMHFEVCGYDDVHPMPQAVAHGRDSMWACLIEEGDEEKLLLSLWAPDMDRLLRVWDKCLEVRVPEHIYDSKDAMSWVGAFKCVAEFQLLIWAS